MHPCMLAFIYLYISTCMYPSFVFLYLWLFIHPCNQRQSSSFFSSTIQFLCRSTLYPSIYSSYHIHPTITCWVRNWDHRVGKTSPTSFSLMDEKNHMKKKQIVLRCWLYYLYTQVVIKAQSTVINHACVSLGSFLRVVIEEGFCRMTRSLPSDLGSVGLGLKFRIRKGRTDFQAEWKTAKSDWVWWCGMSVQVSSVWLRGLCILQGPGDGPGKAARGQMIKRPMYSRGRPRNPLKQERKTWAQSGSKGEGMFEGTEAAGW